MRTVRARGWALLIGVIVTVIVAGLPILTYPLGRDQGEFAAIARGMQIGRVPYQDVWNPKPPAIFVTYAGALALLGERAESLRALDLLIAPPIMLALAFIGQRLVGDSGGVWAALLFGVAYLREDFWTLTQNDGIALLPMTLAALCALQAADADRRAPLWSLAAGALMGVVFWFKYPFALLGLALAAGYVLRARRHKPQGDVARDALAFVFGGVLVVGVGVGLLAGVGALDAWLQSAVVTAGYTTVGADDDVVRDAFQTRIEVWGVLAVLALFGLRRTSGFIALWLLSGAAILLVQWKFYAYHWLPMLPPLALIAGAGAAWLIERLPIAVRAGAAMLAGGALVGWLALTTWGTAFPYLTGAEDARTYAGRFTGGEFNAGESAAVAAYLRERVTPGDSLFIWGFRPEVYFESRLHPANRFIFQFPLVAGWYPAAWREEAVEVLWASLPPYVLVLQADYMPWVTGSDDDSNTLLQAYTELNNWLVYNYERETQIGNFFVWRRKLAA